MEIFMLKFYRKALKAGFMVVKEVWTVDGVEYQKNWTFKATDNNKVFEFSDAEYILAKYPSFFSVPA